MSADALPKTSTSAEAGPAGTIVAASNRGSHYSPGGGDREGATLIPDSRTFCTSYRQAICLVMFKEAPVGIFCYQVILVESGEAVRLGDEVEDSMKTGSSLRIKSGQMFGAEEVRLRRRGWVHEFLQSNQCCRVQISYSKHRCWPGEPPEPLVV